MTHEEFLKSIRKAYLEARKIIYKPQMDQGILSRGTSHSISSITEDLFGCYCADKVVNPSNIKILIDPQISFAVSKLRNKNDKKALLIRPDVALTKSNVATCFFDIKTDLGYKRKEFLEQAKERGEQMSIINGVKSTYNDGETKIQNPLLISKKIQFIYIIISQGNISKLKLDNFINDIRMIKNIDILLLSTGDHLNAYHQNPQWIPNGLDFNKLDNILESQLN